MTRVNDPSISPESSLYLSHFKLKEAPFTLTPNTHFFFSGSDRGLVLDALRYACLHTEGVITLTGEVGTGKTMMSRMLIESKPRHLLVAYILNPSLSPDEIVYAIATELGVRNLALIKPVQVMQRLQNRLIDLHRKGKRVLVLIDEAHVMAPETLDAIRLLSNLETHHHKLLRIILVGQDELNRTLAQSSMRPLRERITERFGLHQITMHEVAEYVTFRLERSGGAPGLFQKEALDILAQASSGITRRINILGDKALLAAFAANAQTVGPEHVREAIAEARLTRLDGLAQRSWRERLRFGSLWWRTRAVA